MTKTEIEESLGVSEADIVPLKPGNRITMAVRYVAPLPFLPLHNQVVIKVLRDDALVTTLWIPESANNKKHAAVGIVIAKGRGHRRRKLIAKGEHPQYAWIEGYCPMDVEPGDHVVFARFAGERHTIDGQSYLITPVEHIYAVLEGYEGETEPATPTQFSQDAYLDAKHGPQTVRASVIGKHSSK